jgi:hypothetical protein
LLIQPQSSHIRKESGDNGWEWYPYKISHSLMSSLLEGNRHMCWYLIALFCQKMGCYSPSISWLNFNSNLDWGTH